MRLAALMAIRVVHVMTHDSIGLGEDGPTHQPVEHLASLRHIPNLFVFRPADALEVAEAWAMALGSERTPSILCLSRQAVPTLPREAGYAEGVRRGAYVLSEAGDGRDVTLIATGSEVQIALAAATELAAIGIRAAVVSAPCFELFSSQPETYRKQVLGAVPRIGIEAALEGGWARWLGEDGIFIGMRGFGASAPAEVLYEKFGITAAAVVQAARRLLSADRTGS
jgi:transketolase